MFAFWAPDGIVSFRSHFGSKLVPNFNERAMEESHAAAVATKVEALPCAVSSAGSDMSAQERLDRRNTAWWLERKAKEQAKEQARLEQMRKDDMEVAAYWEARRDMEHADTMANFKERAMEIVVVSLGLRPGSTSAFATSAGSVVQPAPVRTLQEHTSAVVVVLPAPFSKVAAPVGIGEFEPFESQARGFQHGHRKVYKIPVAHASPVAHAVAHAHADAPVAHADADADADTPPDTEADADHLSYQCPDKCCWICGYADHLSYQCPDKCCWICGYADHLSYQCPDKCCWICGCADHLSYVCPDK